LSHPFTTFHPVTPCSHATALGELKDSLRAIRRVVGSVDPTEISGEQARELVEVLTEAERVVASGVARLTPRVIETGAYAKSGHASGPDWLAAASGSSSGSARSRLAAAERAAVEPELAGPLREGRLSTPELKVLSQAAIAAPDSLPELVGLAVGESSLKELSDAAARAKCAARSKESARLRRARVHASRHFTWHQDEHGGIRGEFLCDEVAWARVVPGLEAQAKDRWRAAGSDDGESLAAHRLDALIEILEGGGAGGEAGVHALVVVDAAALQRGRLNPGETCEIEGIGPVSLDALTELLGDATAQFVIKSGRDVSTVTSSTRAIPKRTSAALVVRDRTCVVPGCGKRLSLETDHSDVDYADGGPTSLANLARLCPGHHDMKTNGGWKIVRAHGRWKWVPPARPPTAGRIARTRRLAATRAKAFKPIRS
jgi:hypothetical protein